jgi:hypothetical protein
MRATVHPDGPRLLGGLRVHLYCDERLGIRIALFPEPEALWGEIKVWDDVARALLLADGHPRGVPRKRIYPAGFVERNAAVVADHPAAGGEPRILVEHIDPITRQIEAGAGGRPGVLPEKRDAER